MSAVVIACAAFFLPPAAGLMARQYMPGVWLTAALFAVAVCAVTGPPIAFAAAVQSVILAVIAVGVTPPPSPSPRRVRRQEDREIEAFAEEIDDADMDLVERVWNAPRPRVKRITGTDSGPGTAP